MVGRSMVPARRVDSHAIGAPNPGAEIEIA
jgi:hypothetical protein